MEMAAELSESRVHARMVELGMTREEAERVDYEERLQARTEALRQRLSDWYAARGLPRPRMRGSHTGGGSLVLPGLSTGGGVMPYDLELFMRLSEAPAFGPSVRRIVGIGNAFGYSTLALGRSTRMLAPWAGCLLPVLLHLGAHASPMLERRVDSLALPQGTGRRNGRRDRGQARLALPYLTLTLP